MKETETLAELKEAVRGRTRAMLKKIPPHRLDWSPVEGALTLGQLLRHIWKSEEGICKLARGDWEYLERRLPEGLSAVLGEVEDLETELRNLEDAHGKTLELIRSLSGEELNEEHFNDKLNIRRSTRENIYMLIEHEAHHRGQIALYLRIMGVEDASPYGARFK